MKNQAKEELRDLGKDAAVEVGKWALRTIWRRIKSRIQRRRAARRGRS